MWGSTEPPWWVSWRTTAAGCRREQVLVGGGGGLGLMGMRERAVGAGGQVTVQSELGRGTRVRLVIPLNNGDA